MKRLRGREREGGMGEREREGGMGERERGGEPFNNLTNSKEDYMYM